MSSTHAFGVTTADEPQWLRNATGVTSQARAPVANRDIVTPSHHASRDLAVSSLDSVSPGVPSSSVLAILMTSNRQFHPYVSLLSDNKAVSAPGPKCLVGLVGIASDGFRFYILHTANKWTASIQERRQLRIPSMLIRLSPADSIPPTLSEQCVQTPAAPHPRSSPGGTSS